MVTIISVLKTIKATKNFWAVIPLRISKKKKKVICRKGCETKLSVPEYRMTLSFLFKSYSVESIGKSLCFVKGKIKITAPFFSVKELLNEEFDETYSGRLCQRSCFRYRWL